MNKKLWLKACSGDIFTGLGLSGLGTQSSSLGRAKKWARCTSTTGPIITYEHFIFRSTISCLDLVSSNWGPGSTSRPCTRTSRSWCRRRRCSPSTTPWSSSRPSPSESFSDATNWGRCRQGNDCSCLNLDDLGSNPRLFTFWKNNSFT